MAAHDESSAEPGIAEIGFYFGTGAFVTFVLVATLGLSILGHPVTADARNERIAAAAVASEADELGAGA